MQSTQPEYKQLHIHFRIPDIEWLSDRTYNALNKGCRNICRQVISESLEIFLRRMDLPENYKQSVKARSLKQLQNHSTFIVEDVRKGSFDLIVYVILALAPFVLAKTIGKDIETEWPNTNFSKWFRRLLRADIKKLPHKLENLEKCNQQASQIAAEQILPGIKGKIIANRFSITSVEFRDEDGRIIATVTANTLEEVKGKIKMEGISPETATTEIEKVKKMIEDLDDRGVY